MLYLNALFRQDDVCFTNAQERFVERFQQEGSLLVALR